jgi:hypothetical protein
MKLDNRKILKFAVLLISTILIGFVSAATYSELFMYGTPISIGTASVTFTSGANTTAMGGGDAINSQGTEVTFDTIAALEPGEIRTYEEAVNITNGAGSTKALNVSLSALTGNFTANFDYLNITVFNSTGAQQGASIEIVSSGSNVTTSGSLSIPNSAVWYVRWIIKAKQGATNGHSINITLMVKVE